jgi:hypothetical protein
LGAVKVVAERVEVAKEAGERVEVAMGRGEVAAERAGEATARVAEVAEEDWVVVAEAASAASSAGWARRSSTGRVKFR